MWMIIAQQKAKEGKLVDRYSIFKMATNDYMGRGGSGFFMLEINSTRVDTAISLRDIIIDYIRDSGGKISASDYMTSEQDGTTRIKMIR